MRKGQQVSWKTSQRRTHGRTVERRTQEFQHDEQTFSASTDEPSWIVESDRTGATAATRESTLTSEE